MTSPVSHEGRGEGASAAWRFYPFSACLLLALVSALGLSACDRNTAPPQKPTTHVIEFTRLEHGSEPVASGVQDLAPAMPYGAAAPMAFNPPDTLAGAIPFSPGGAATSTPRVPLSATEMAFITQASEAGLFDMRMGQLGSERASNAAVRSYAVMLVTDQVALSSGLQQLARQLGVPLPSSLSEPKQQILDSLARTDVQEFDRQFVSAGGVRGHAATIELFERTGRDTRNPQVRAFVLNNLPLLRAHLSVAERLPIKG